MRTATKEVDRRHSPRYHLGLRGTATIAGQTLPVVLDEIAADGLTVSGEICPVTPGMRVEVAIAGCAVPLSLVAMECEKGRIHGHLDLSPDLAPRWHDEFLRMTANQKPEREAA